MTTLKIIYSRNDNFCELDNICYKCGAFDSDINKINDYFEHSIADDDISLCEKCVQDTFVNNYSWDF